MKRKSLIALIISAVMVFYCVNAFAESTFTTITATETAASTNIALNKEYTLQYSFDKAKDETLVTWEHGTASMTDDKYDEGANRVSTLYSQNKKLVQRGIFVLDLGQTTMVNTIKMKDHRNGGFQNYTISVANTNTADTVWTPVSEGAISWKYVDTTSNKVEWEETFAPQYARYVKIDMNEAKSYSYNPAVGNTKNEISGSIIQVMAYNKPYYMTGQNYANADVYTNVSAYSVYSANSSFHGSSWFAAQGVQSVVKPSYSGTVDSARAFNAWLQNKAMWMVIDLGEERSINTLQLVPYYSNIDKFTLYSATAEQYETIKAITTDVAIDTDTLASLTKICEGSGMARTDLGNYPNGQKKADFTRDFVVSESFENTTARYLVLVVNKLVGADSERKAVCYIRSFEVYDWKIDDVDTADATSITVPEKYSGTTVNGTVTVSNVSIPKSGLQKDNKQVLICEYDAEDVMSKVTPVTLSVYAGEAVVLDGVYEPEADTAKVKFFAWEADGSLVPLTEAGETEKVQ